LFPDKDLPCLCCNIDQQVAAAHQESANEKKKKVGRAHEKLGRVLQSSIQGVLDRKKDLDLKEVMLQGDEPTING
jgi:hypothetical protein